MSAGERGALLSELREALVSLAEDGVDYLPRPVVPAAASSSEAGAGTEPGADKARALAAVREELGDCQRCTLCEKRKNIVFGEGNPNARVVFVGEGPGADEDRTGRPFVGRAGELLTRMIEALGWSREDVYICNIVKCRPPGNRDPQLSVFETVRESPSTSGRE